MRRSHNEMQKEVLDNYIRMKTTDGEQGTLFSQVEKKRSPLSREAKLCLWMLAALVVIFVLSFFFISDYAVSRFSLAYVGKYAIRRMNDMVDLLAGNHVQSAIHWFLLSFVSPVIAGVALSGAGAAYQSLFQNPMASPTILGVQSGGALGSLIFLKFFYTPMLSPLLAHGDFEMYALEWNSMNFGQKFGQYFFTLGGCITIVVIVLVLSKVVGRGKIETVPMLVGGTVFTGCISSILSMVEYYEATYGGDTMIAEEVQSLQAGAFESVFEVPLVLSLLVTAMVPWFIMFFCRNRMNVLVFGEEEARALGVSVRNSRVLFIILSTMMTAAVITFCGNIAFVGLIMPHFARQVVGSDFRYLLPASGIMGAILMLCAYDVAYAMGFYVNVGIVVSTLGSAVFLVCMIVNRRRGNADWA